MSLPAPETVVDPPTGGAWWRRGARSLRWLRRLRDLLAVLGVVAIVLLGWLYQQGLREAGALSPDTRRYLAGAGWNALQANVADALSTRVVVAEGTTPEALETALRARATELGLPLELLYPLPTAANDEASTGSGADAAPEYALRVWTACSAEQVARLVALEPRLLAFMPCRIALHRDAAGRLWLATVNLELLVTGGREPVDALRREAVGARDRILDLIAAAGG